MTRRRKLPAAVALGRRGAKKGGQARAATRTPLDARIAAEARHNPFFRLEWWRRQDPTTAKGRGLRARAMVAARKAIAELERRRPERAALLRDPAALVAALRASRVSPSLEARRERAIAAAEWLGEWLERSGRN